MRYTQQQVLTILTLDQTTFVYWMRAIPRIARLKGKGCHFLQPDILALGVIAEATRELGCAIGSLGLAIDRLFDAFQGFALSELEDQLVLLDRHQASLRRRAIVLEDEQRPVAIIPIGPIIDKIISWNERDQYLLPF